MLSVMWTLVLLSLVVAPLSTAKSHCPPLQPNSSVGFRGCTDNLTLRLGNNYTCDLLCSNSSLAYILLFGLLGILGLTALATLGLTVSTGTFNAVLLYVNIVQANYHIFFRYELSGRWRLLQEFLTMFLSWLNMEWGFKTCFGRKMDAIMKTELRYVFPIYMCLLACIFVRISSCGIRTRQYCRKLAHSVLATTLLMAFSPILRTFIDTMLTVDGCWLYDINKRFKAKHNNLLIGIGSLLIIFLLAFTLLLTFAPPLEPITHYKPISWIKKPIISAIVSKFQLPLSKSSIPWPAIFLLVRVLLFATAAVVRNNRISANTNLRVMVVTLLCLVLSVWFVGVPYKKTVANLTLVAFLVNLGVLAVWSGGGGVSDQQQSVLTYVMVGGAALMFSVLVGHHTVQRTHRLVMCVRDCRQRQNIDDVDQISGQALDEEIQLESIHDSLEAEYCEVGSDMGTEPSIRLGEEALDHY